MKKSIIKCRQLTKSYANIPALRDISFTLCSNEILSILGPSGCGKTTLLRLIAGFEKPDSGEIFIGDHMASSGSIHIPTNKRNIGVVFQEYALFPHMTVSENISFGLSNLDKTSRSARLNEAIGLVKLNGLEYRYPHELSGGQQQRLALARTLATRPVAILLDEPFSNLDSVMRREMRQEMKSILRENNIATIFVTHDRIEAFATSDKIAIMKEGKFQQVDTPESIYYSPANKFVAEMSRTCDFIHGTYHNGTAYTDIGNLPCSLSSDRLMENQSVLVLIHPDDFRVLPDPNGKSTIHSREFRGDETMLTVNTPEGNSIRCRHRSYSAITPGTRVSLISTRGTPFIAFLSNV